jgi:hypothetical protein
MIAEAEGKWWHGCEHLTLEPSGLVRWRGRQVHRILVSPGSPEYERENAIVLRAQCLKLEREGKWSPSGGFMNDLDLLNEEIAAARMLSGIAGPRVIVGIASNLLNQGRRNQRWEFKTSVAMSFNGPCSISPEKMHSILRQEAKGPGCTWEVATREQFRFMQDGMSGFAQWFWTAMQSRQGEEACAMKKRAVLADLAQAGIEENSFPSRREAMIKLYGEDVAALAAN